MDASSDVFPEYFIDDQTSASGGEEHPMMAYTGGSARKGAVFRLQVYERIRIATAEVNKRVGKSFWKLFGSVKGPKRANK